MLARKRGTGTVREKSKKMAMKKAVLQTDVSTEEEWEKILERPGLVVVDVYSEWSGPCAGMISALRKIKMEMGGDSLSYATAKCDTIRSLARFQGKSEPIWMFLREGKMVNLVFGANSPKLVEILTKEVKKVQNDIPPDYSISVEELSPIEIERQRKLQEELAAAEAVRLAKIEAEAKAKYEAKMDHLLTSLPFHSVVILFPWVFKDEDGNKRTKSSSPPYTELTPILKQFFNVEQEVLKLLDEDTVNELQKETGYEFSEETKRMLLEDKSCCFRLKFTDKSGELDFDQQLINEVYGNSEVAQSPEDLAEDCYVARHLPPLEEFIKDTISMESVPPANTMVLTTVWIPMNARNRVIAFAAVFSKWLDQNFPYEEPVEDAPVTVFKYDSTRKKELKAALEAYANDVINFGVFERDKLPEPKMIAINMEQYESDEVEKTSYEVFVCVVKKSTPESFLSFAGIGPYHVSENSEIALEEAMQYFPEPIELKPEEGSGSDEDEEEKDEKEEKEEEEATTS